MRRYRIAVAACAIAPFGVLLLSLTKTPSERRAGPPSISARWPELESTLRALRQTWRPAERLDLLAEARRQSSTLAPAICELLALERHPLQAEVLALAEHLEDESLTSSLIELALHPKRPLELRASAIAVVAATGGWDKEYFVRLLADEHLRIVRATLDALAQRDHVLWRPILDLLGHEDRAIRMAAAAAIPENLPVEALPQIVEVISLGDRETAVATIRALTTSKPTAEFEALLVAQLAHEDPLVLAAILEALATKASPLRDAQRIWGFVEDSLAPLEQARALIALERTASVSNCPLRDSTSNLHPFTRYFLGRCLLVAGHLDGIDMLIHVATEDRDVFRGIDEDLVITVQHSSAQILAELTGTTPLANPDVWREWSANQTEIAPQVLTPFSLPQPAVPGTEAER